MLDEKKPPHTEGARLKALRGVELSEDRRPLTYCGAAGPPSSVQIVRYFDCLFPVRGAQPVVGLSAESYTKSWSFLGLLI